MEDIGTVMTEARGPKTLYYKVAARQGCRHNLAARLPQGCSNLANTVGLKLFQPCCKVVTTLWLDVKKGKSYPTGYPIATAKHVHIYLPTYQLCHSSFLA